MIKRVNLLLIAVLLIFLNSCATPVKNVPKPTINVPVGRKTKPIQFKKIVVKLRRGEVIGSLCIDVFCIAIKNLTWKGGKMTLTDDDFTDVFREELERANYTVVGDPDALFEDPSEWKAEILIAGLVKNFKGNLCFPFSGFGNYTDGKGEAYLTVEWQIYSRLDRKVVKKIVTEGSYKQTHLTPDPGYNIAVNAFSNATRNLLGNPDFYSLLTKEKPKYVDKLNKPIPINLVTSSSYSIPENLNIIRSGVATVFAGGGHGSGFFISSDGYLLTNYHVVKDAKFVNVKLVTGREIIGEVIRKNPGRDVALVQVEERGMTPLPLGTSIPAIGADVYSIGSPLEEEYSSTVSKGIISGFRNRDGMSYIQSDVNLLPGNSGGPILDKNGSVIGIAVESRFYQGVMPVGINFLIPINDACSHLGINLKENFATSYSSHMNVSKAETLTKNTYNPKDDDKVHVEQLSIIANNKPVEKQITSTGPLYSLHVESHAKKYDAQRRCDQLESEGFESQVIEADLGKKGTWYRVCIGDYESFNEANQEAIELKRNNKFKYAMPIIIKK